MTAFIAFALLVFVVEEGLRNKSVFSGSSTKLGEVNGQKIDYRDFEKKMQEVEQNAAAQGYQFNDQIRASQRDALWNQYVEDAVMTGVYDNIGFNVTDAEFDDYVANNPTPDLRQNFVNQQTNQYDPQQVKQFLQQLRRNKNSAQSKMFYEQFRPAMLKQILNDKFRTLYAQSMYVPKWLAEKLNNESTVRASASFVNVPYTTIVDSTIQVTDEEIRQFVNKNKARYKQERAMGFDYVIFSGNPTSADTAALRDQLTKIKDSFATTTDNNQFLLNEGSASPFYDGFIARKEIQIPNIDTIIKTPVGSVFGPYLDYSFQNRTANMNLAKVVAARQVPEMVKVRHILISTHQRDPNTGELVQVRLESDAKKIIDSIENAIKGGSIFDSVCAKMSEDGTRDKGGVYDSVKTSQMDAKFNDFIFTNPVGTKGIVQTVYGYHYIEILANRGGMVPAYKIAYLSKPILASQETADNARSQATQFLSTAHDKKSFDETAKKLNVPVFNAAEITPMTFAVPGLNGNSRELVKWLFNDGKIDKVSENPFLIGDDWVVPVVTHSYEEGLMDVNRARLTAEVEIRQEKKAAMIAQKIGTAASLDEVSKITGQPILHADSISLGTPVLSPGLSEPKVVGAVFNKAYETKISPAIAGISGAFVVKTDKVYAVPSNTDVTTQKLIMQMNNKNNLQSFNPVQIYKKDAKIKDFRYKFF